MLASARAGGLVGQPARLRLWLLVAIILAAVLTPPVTLRPSLPDLRLEQVLALPAFAWLALDWRRGMLARPALLDWLFLAIALSTLASILYAPFALGSQLSARDPYEVLKVGLYWTLYRFGRQAAGGWRAGANARQSETASGPAVPNGAAAKADVAYAADPPANAPPARARKITANWPVERAPGSWPLATALQAILVGGALSGFFGLAQYYNWLAVNRWATPLWAPAHHLRTLAEDGRAVGTVGNPNYFGMLCALVLRLAVARLSVGRWQGLRANSVTLAALVGGSFGLVTSGSRGATLAWLAGMLTLWAGVLLRRPGGPIRRGDRARPVSVAGLALGRGTGSSRRLLLASGGTLLSLLLAVAVVEAAPRGRTDYLSRMAHSVGADSDGSLALRIERWRSVLLPWLGKAAATDPAVGLIARTSSHATGVVSAGPEAQARDEQRKADLRTLALAIGRYRSERGALPLDEVSLPSTLVPAYLERMPLDPAGLTYYYERTAIGFSLAAGLEDPADPDYPIYGIGSALNYLQNGDLERGGGAAASSFRSIAGTRYALTDAGALFGERAARFLGNPAQPEQRAALFQQRYFGRPGGDWLTAALWLKLPAAIEGDLSLYVNVLYADGSRADPLVRVPADTKRLGVWQRVSAGIVPEAGKRVTYVGVYLMGEDFRGEALVDGFELVDGSVPLSLPLLREAPPSIGGYDAEARLRESPLLGVGPQKAEGEGAVDNEYLLIAARYGLVGLTLYLALWLTTATSAWRGSRLNGATGDNVASLATATRLAVAAIVAGFLVFDLVAGSWLHLQLMGVFWPLAGVALATRSLQSDAKNGARAM